MEGETHSFESYFFSQRNTNLMCLRHDVFAVHYTILSLARLLVLNTECMGKFTQITIAKALFQFWALFLNDDALGDFYSGSYSKI